MKARFTGVNHYQDGEPIETGDVIELTDAQYENWSYQFEPVDGSDTPDPQEEQTADESEEDDSPSEDDADAAAAEDTPDGEGDNSDLDAMIDQTVADLRDDLATGAFDEYLDDLEMRERQRDSPRSTAIDAIEDRMAALEED